MVENQSNFYGEKSFTCLTLSLFRCLTATHNVVALVCVGG